MPYQIPSFDFLSFGGSPAVMVSIMAPTLSSTWNQVQQAFSTLSTDPSNTGAQFEYQYYANVSNVTLQNSSQAVANSYEITKKILDNTRP